MRHFVVATLPAYAPSSAPAQVPPRVDIGCATQPDQRVKGGCTVGVHSAAAITILRLYKPHMLLARALGMQQLLFRDRCCWHGDAVSSKR